MAALDFPASPTAGQVYEGDNGVIYTYVGTAPNGHWSAFAELSSESFADIFVEVKGDNMTGDLTLGTDKITLNADGSALFTGTTRVQNDTNAIFYVDNPTSGIKGVFNASAYSLNLGTTNGANLITIGQNDSPALAIDTSKNVLIGGTLPNDPNISLESNGHLYSSAAYISDRTAANAAFIARLNGTQNVTIRTDGTSDLAGDVKIGGLLPNLPNISLKASDGSAEFAGGKAEIGKDGEAMFADNRILIANNGQTRIKHASTGSYSFQVASNTADPCFQVNANGSSEFAGDVQIGDEPRGGVNNGIYMSANAGEINLTSPSTGQVLSIRANGSATQTAFITGSGKANFADSVMIGGDYLNDNPNILLKANGSGTFEGSVAVGGPLAGVDGGTEGTFLSTTGRVYATSKDGALPIWEGFTLGNTTSTSSISASGSAFFKGSTLIGNLTSAPNISLKADGSAEFASGLAQVFSNGTIRVGDNPSSSSSYGIDLNATHNIRIRTTETDALLVYPNSASQTPTIALREKGSAYFASDIISGVKSASTSYVQIYAAGNVVSRRPNASKDQAVFLGGFGDGTNYQTTAQIFGNGSAEFASGNVKLLANSKGAQFNVNRTAGNGNEAVLVGQLDDADTSVIRADGSATFDGTVTADNVTFNLEADDDTKYTATTDSEGVETLVYNGAVLDVKDRLQKTDAALTALKSAAAAASDFAALKSAIATALADI